MKTMKSIVIVLVTVALITGSAIAAWAARKNVIISEQNWTGSTVICHVMKYVIENKLKTPVQIKQLSGSVTWAGMEKGDVDVFSDIWETAEIAGIEKYTKERKTCGVVLSYPKAPQGWYIPQYVVDKYGIKSVEDIKGKEKIFDINNDGKGDIWVGPTSWKANEIHKVRIRDYGLDLDPNGVEQWAWLTTLKDAYKKQQPVIFFYWEPEWLFTQYDLHKVDEPAFDPAKFVFIEGKPEESKIICEMEPSDVWVGYSLKLKDRLPKVYQFYQNWFIPIKEVNKMIAMVSDLPDSPKMSNEEMAEKWVADNPEIVNDWLKGIE